MRGGAPVDPNLSLAEMMPPDKADQSGILQAGFAVVEAIARRAPTAGPVTATITLEAAGWAALEAETRRPYRGHAAYKYTPHPGGAGAVRWVREGVAAACEDRQPNGPHVCDLPAGHPGLHREHLDVLAEWGAARIHLSVPSYSATVSGIDP